MTGKKLGIVVLFLIIAATLGYQMILDKKKENRRQLKGFITCEKKTFLQDEEVKEILRNRFNCELVLLNAGSIEMVQGEIDRTFDFLWPTSQVALNIFKMRPDVSLLNHEFVFNSPLVFYSWDRVTEALIKAGLVHKEGESYYVNDLSRLIRLVVEGKKWSDIGLKELYGKISITSTHPSRSNPGNILSGLVATMLHGDIVNVENVDPVLPQIQSFFGRLGHMEVSSADLFDKFVHTGLGAKPIIAGYENQIVEFSLQNPDLWSRLKDKIRISYPIPTVWSSHPILILKDNAKPLIEALKDQEVQRLAWEKHGFRTGLIGLQNDLTVFKALGIPATITQVIQMPSPQVMNKIIEAVRGL